MVVTWSATGAGGSFASATSTTNAGGLATVSFTTSSTAGTVHEVTATDVAGRTGTSAAVTTTTAPSPPGGGGGGGAAPSPPAGGIAGAVAVTGVDGVYTIAAGAGTTELIDPFGPGTSLKVTFTSAATGTITVKSLSSLPSGVGAPPAGNVLALFDIQSTGEVSNAVINKVVFRFTAPWVVPNVALQRYANGTWTTLPATWIGVSNGLATFEAQSTEFSIYAITGDRVGAGTATSALGVTATGPFTRATKVTAVGEYVTVKFSLGSDTAGKKVVVWTATKSSSGRWSSFTKTTTRVADANGDVYYSVRSPASSWKSFKAAFDGEGPLVPKATSAVQARWR
jgi:PGF-pre-PGF domain-containing protein